MQAELPQAESITKGRDNIKGLLTCIKWLLQEIIFWSKI